LGAYTKSEDEDINTTFGARGKIWLSKVFNVIGFIYPDYYFPARRKSQKRKTSLKFPSSVLKQKKVKIPANRSKSYYIKRAVVIPTLSATVTGETKAMSLKDASLVILKVTNLGFYSDWLSFY
jgi:hypothetical protein